MDYHVTVVHDHPAVARLALADASLPMLLPDGFQRGLGQRIQHTIARAGAQDEVIRERGDILYVEQQNILRFLRLKRTYDLMRQFKSVQASPRCRSLIDFCHLTRLTAP
jgi:hypothetical protein